MESTFIRSTNLQEFKGTEDQYHADKDHISASGLKRLKVSPAHFMEEEEIIETDAILFGSAYHCFILEPAKFEKEYYVFDDHAIYEVLIGEGFKSPRATKQYKEWMESEMRIIGDRKSISKDDFEKIQAMRNKLMKHPYAKMLLSNGHNEIGYMGEIETEAGIIKVKIKPDHLNDIKKIIVDLKTTFDASLDGFTRHAADFDMHIQASLYSDLLNKISGDNMDWTFFFIGQEKKKPYAFNIFEASPQFISQGRYEYEMLLQLYKFCLDNNYWPGYQVWCQNKYGILELKLPAWSIKDLTYYDHYTKQLVLTN
jgi:exodeoxyribonuclease VIII